MSEEPTKTSETCLRCQQPLWTFGVQKFRIGGTTGGWKMLVGEWAELGEDMVPLEMLACRGAARSSCASPATADVAEGRRAAAGGAAARPAAAPRPPGGSQTSSQTALRSMTGVS